MAELNTVIVRLVADIKEFEGGLAKADASLQKFGTAAERRSATMSRTLGRVTTGIIGVGAGVAYYTTKMATNFQSATLALQLHAGESAKNLNMVRQGLLDLSGKTAQTPLDLAKAMYWVESAGYHGAAGLKVMKTAAQGAAVGGADLTTTADALTTAMKDYHAPVKDSASYMNQLITSVSRGKTTLEGMAGSMGRILPLAANLKIPFSEITAAMSTLTVAGNKPNISSRWLFQLLTRLSAPTSTSNKIFAAVGLSAQDVLSTLTDPKKGLVAALTLVEDHIAKKVPRGSAEYRMALREALGSTQAMNAALALTGTHAKEFASNYSAIAKAAQHAGMSVKDYSVWVKSAAGQQALLKANVSKLGVEIGTALLPAKQDLLRWALGAIDFFKKHPLITKIATDSAIGLFVASVAYKLAKGISSAFGLVKSIFTGTAIGSNTVATEENTAAVTALTETMGGSSVAGGAGGAAGGLAKGGALGLLARGGMLAGGALAVNSVVSAQRNPGQFLNDPLAHFNRLMGGWMSELSNIVAGHSATNPTARLNTRTPGFMGSHLGPLTIHHKTTVRVVR